MIFKSRLMKSRPPGGATSEAGVKLPPPWWHVKDPLTTGSFAPVAGITGFLELVKSKGIDAGEKTGRSLSVRYTPGRRGAFTNEHGL